MYDKQSDLPKTRRELVALIFKIAFLEAMALSLILPSVTSTGEITQPNICTTSNGICGPIRFDSAVSARSNSTNSLTTTSWSAIPNETIVAVSSANGLVASQVNSVTDNFGDTFTRLFQLRGTAFSPPTPTYDLEVWTAKTSANGANAVTATWNITDQFILQASAYQNSNGIGNSTSLIQANPSNSISTSLMSAKSGSWIIGIVGDRSTDSNTCASGPAFIVTSPLFIKRVDTCTNFGSPETQISDNATSIRNGLSLTFSPSIPPPNEWLVAVELEVLPIDLEPQGQNINTSTLCFTSGDTCHTNFANRVSGINTAQNIILNTAYCTGLTTSALTISTASNVQLYSTYSGQSRNETGDVLLVQLYVSTNAPSTSFGSGLCAVGGAIISMGKIYFATSGSTLTSYGLNTYQTSVLGVCPNNISPCNSSATLYAWIEITLQQCVGCGTSNTLQYAQWGAIGFSSISMLQIK